MKRTSLNDAHLRKLQSKSKEFVVTDDVRLVTSRGTLSLCLRVFPTGRKLWALRMRQARRSMRTLGAFAPGTDPHLSLQAARELLAAVARQIESCSAHHIELDPLLDLVIERLGCFSTVIPTPHCDSTGFARQVSGDVELSSAEPIVRVGPRVAQNANTGNAPISRISWNLNLSQPSRPTTSLLKLSAISSNAAASCLPSGSVVLVPGSVAPSLRLPADSVVEAQHRVSGQSATLKSVVDVYIQQLIDAGKRGSARDYRSLFRRRVIEPHPELANRDATLIRPDDVVKLIRDTLTAPRKTRNRSAHALHLDERTSHALPMKREADKLRVMLKGAFNACLRSHLDPNIFHTKIDTPQIGVNPAESVVPVRGAIQARHRTLSADEMAAVVMRLGTVGTAAADVLETCIWLGGQRLAQVLRAEVGNYDAEAGTLLIFDGKGRRTTPRPHLLPVKGRATNLLEKASARALRLTAGPSPYLFSTTGRVPVDGQTASDLLSDIKAELLALGHVKSDFDVRDMRRTVETVLASRGVSKDDRAHLLSHGLGGVQNAHYDRYDHYKEKIRAIDIWHAWLNEATRDFLRRFGDVIPYGKPTRVSKKLQRSELSQVEPAHQTSLSADKCVPHKPHTPGETRKHFFPSSLSDALHEGSSQAERKGP